MRSVLEYIEKSVSSYPDKLAFSDEKREMTYRDLYVKSRTIGTFLSKKTTGRSPIAVLLDKTVDSLAALMGVVYSGNFYTVLDAQMPTARMQTILKELSPAAVLTDRAHEKQVAETCFDGPVLMMDEALSGTLDDEILSGIRAKSIDTDPVYVLFTSGSTGVPKGTVVCHRSIMAYTEWVSETFSLDQTTVFANQTPFYFSMSVLDLYSTLGNAATMHIIPKSLFIFPTKLIEYMGNKGVNTLYWVPSALSVISNWKAFDYVAAPPLQKILFAGEVMPAKVLNYWSAHLPGALYANLYGPTEVTDICSYYIVNRKFSNEDSIPIGSACRNCDVLVVTPDGREAMPDEEGELLVRGSFLAMGYYNNPQKTAEAFVQNPLNQHYPELVYKTGDIVKRNSYGELIYITRKDFQIKHMGYRIELGEIEAAADALEEVESCAGVFDAQADQIILFYQGRSIDNAAMLKALRKRLPNYMMPSKLFRLEQMLYNSNGKIDRTRLKLKYETELKDGAFNG